MPLIDFFKFWYGRHKFIVLIILFFLFSVIIDIGISVSICLTSDENTCAMISILLAFFGWALNLAIFVLLYTSISYFLEECLDNNTCCCLACCFCFCTSIGDCFSSCKDIDFSSCKDCYGDCCKDCCKDCFCYCCREYDEYNDSRAFLDEQNA